MTDTGRLSLGAALSICHAVHAPLEKGWLAAWGVTDCLKRDLTYCYVGGGA